MRRMARVAPLSIHVDVWVTWLHRHLKLVWQTPPHSTDPDRLAAPTLVLLRALTASTLALALLLLHKATYVLPLLPSLDEALGVVATVVVILLAARVAAAIQRWRMGNSDFHALIHAARSIVLLACSFLSEEINVAVHSRFLTDLKRFAVVYVALAVNDCTQQHVSVDVIDQLHELLTDEELATLQTTMSSNENKSYAAVVELWLRCRVSHAGFTKTPARLLLPHVSQVVELQYALSSLPLLYGNVRMTWRDPPVWGYWTQHTPFGILGYLLFYSFVRIPTVELGAVVWVFIWGLSLFGIDSLAHSIEHHHFTDERSLHAQLLDMQEELNACLNAFFRPLDGLETLRRHDRSLTDPQYPSRPRENGDVSSPRSPISNPVTRTLPDGPTKPSLKQVLDLITTDSTTVSSPSAVAIEMAIREGERQPLLPAQRTDLFLQYNTQRINDEASDETDEDEDDAEYTPPV